MVIKELAYDAQQYLQSQTTDTFKRAHIYELLAASFGFSSYAALTSDAVFTHQESLETNHSVRRQFSAKIRLRCIDLGYQSNTLDITSIQLPVFLAGHQISVIKLSDLVSDLHQEYEDWGGYPQWEAEFPSILLDSLKGTANRESDLAHYALALIHAPLEEKVNGAHWHSQAKQGRKLTGVEKEWADAYGQSLVNAQKYAFHLREAARLGNVHALFDLAERFDDPSFFENIHNHTDLDPIRVADAADQMGRMMEVRHWLTIAAIAGDITAMRRLIEEFDQGELHECWTWLYLAQLLGTDLTQDAYYAINEDGSLYDDDIGGPAYVGGEGGVKLAPLSSEQDAVARQNAEKFFKQIEQSK